MAENDPANLAQKICELCNENSSKYCCPRCSILYCSLDCYKSENHAECSEGFYRDSVHEELASYHADDESKQKMIDILEKMQAEGAGGDVAAGHVGEPDDDIENFSDDSDDDIAINLHERLKDLDLNNADAIWDAMTVDERNEFEAMINMGEIGGIVPQWEPWWLYRKEKKLVEDLNKKVEEVKRLKGCPVHKKVPEMSALTTVQPSQAIRYNITNILAAYAFTIRYFNGEVDAVEWAIYFLNICANLDTNTNFEEPALAVESVVQKCLQSQLIQTDKESLDVMRYDTFLILQGPSEENPKHYCKSALSHVHRILSHAKTAAKTQPKILNKTEEEKKVKDAKDKTFSKKFPEHEVKKMFLLDINKVKKCLKKVEYYLSYVETQSMDFELDDE